MEVLYCSPQLGKSEEAIDASGTCRLLSGYRQHEHVGENHNQGGSGTKGEGTELPRASFSISKTADADA